MNKNDLLKALEFVKKNSPKRKFKQTYDLIINLKGIDLKKTDNQIDVFAQLHHERGKNVKVCALVGPELKPSSEKFCDNVVLLDDFDKYAKDKKITKKLSKDNDFFIAQANIMPKVAGAFGKVFGPRGKMPNPKAGCIVPPNANLEPLVKKLQNTVRIRILASPLFQCRVGNEDTTDENVVANAMDVYNALIHALPNEKHNVKSIYLKLTMGPSVKVGAEIKEVPKEEPKAEEKKEKPPKEEKPKEKPKKEDPKKEPKKK